MSLNEKWSEVHEARKRLCDLKRQTALAKVKREFDLNLSETNADLGKGSVKFLNDASTEDVIRRKLTESTKVELKDGLVPWKPEEAKVWIAIIALWVSQTTLNGTHPISDRGRLPDLLIYISFVLPAQI